MKIILARLFPELDRFESDNDRQIAYRTACKNQGFASWYIFLAVYGSGFAFNSFAIRFLVKQAALPTLAAAAVTFPVILLWVQAPIWFLRKRLRTDIRRQLNQADKPTCIQCGYNLTVHTTNRCPECGATAT
jgi:hypothetical protein